MRRMPDHVANAFHTERDDLEMSPFDAKMDTLLDELNEVLVA